MVGTGNLPLVNADVGSGDKAIFVPVTPERILDTRDGTGGITGPIAAGGSFELQVTGKAGIPADATAVVMNVTATEGTRPTFITVWPAGAERPTASNVNPAPGESVPNLVTVKLGDGGRLAFFNYDGTMQLIADVAGYYVDHHHDDRYYSEAEVDQLLAAQTAAFDAKLEALDDKVDKLSPLDHVAWASMRPSGIGENLRVYESQGAEFSISRTGTGVYDVTVGGFEADGAYHSIFLTPEQSQVSVFRACKVFQTPSAGDPADTLRVIVRCFDQNATLSDTGFHIMVIDAH